MSAHDYVIVGAGSAGCLLANRLTANGASVLLLEAGGSDRRPEVMVPAAFPNQFQTAIDWNFMSEPEPGLFGRRLFLAQAHAVRSKQQPAMVIRAAVQKLASQARGGRSQMGVWCVAQDPRESAHVSSFRSTVCP